MQKTDKQKIKMTVVYQELCELLWL